MASETGPAHRRRDRMLGGAGQVAAVIGIVLSVLLAAGALLGRAWALDTVDQLSGRVDQAIERALPPLDTASTLVGDVSQRIGDVATAADAVAALPAPQNDRVAALQDKLQSLGDRYLELRASYADVRQNITDAIARLQAIDRVLPGVSLPQGPIDKLAELDAKIQRMDGAIMAVIGANLAGNAVDQVAGNIAAKAREAQSNLDGVSDRLAGVATDLEALQANLSDIASSAKAAITLGVVAVILLLLWLVLLHWILFRVSRRLWLANAEAPAATGPTSAIAGSVPMSNPAATSAPAAPAAPPVAPPGPEGQGSDEAPTEPVPTG
jgi:phage shock protein A